MRSRYFLALLVIASFYACSSSENAEDSNTGQAPIELAFETVDSLNLAILGNPVMASVNESGSLISFFDFPSSEILTTDSEGSILHRFSKTEDSPDTYGFRLDLPVIWGRDRVIQIGMLGIFIYDLDGNMIKKIDHPESMGGAASMTITGKSSKIVSFDGHDYLLMQSIRSRDTYPGEQKFYDTYKALDLVNLETGDMIEIGPFEPESKFLDGKGYIQSDYAPAFATEGNKLYLSHGSEPKVYVYDFSDTYASLDTALSLNIPGFFEIEGKDRSEFSKGGFSVSMGNAAIRNIFVQNGKILIHFHPGLDPKIMEEVRALFKEGKRDEGNAIYKKASSKSLPGILVYDETNLAFLGKMDFPEGTNTSGLMADREFIYFEKLPNADIEEDFLRIYKMKIVAK